jgi:hypothetical protein
MPALSDYVSIKRRYSRSVNLERDIEIPDSIIGYIHQNTSGPFPLYRGRIH